MDNKQSKKIFSRLGLGLFAMLAVLLVTQTLWFKGPGWFLGQGNALDTSSTWMWLGNMIPMYLCAMPVFVLIVHKLPVADVPKVNLEKKHMLMLIPICFAFMYAGNILGNLLSFVFSGGTAQNRLIDYINDPNPLKYLHMVILAPLMEEFIFRRQIIDRTRQYGEKTAVFLSAIMFGLFHQNLYQFFYAFGVGLLLGYMYVRSGRLRYSVFVHMCINFVGSVISPLLLQLTEYVTQESADNLENLPLLLLAVVGILAISSVVSGLSVSGIVLFSIRCKKATWLPAPEQIPGKQVFRRVYLNVGVIAFSALCILLTVWTLFAYA